MPEQRLSALLVRLRDIGQVEDVIGLAADGSVDPPVHAVRYDSRAVRPGDLFVARPGQRADGHDYVTAAMAAGAVAALVEHPDAAVGGPLIVVRDAKLALAEAAAWRAGDPSLQLGVVGVTGTDGKTTTAYLIRAILEGAGYPTGLIGTTDVVVAGTSLGNAARTSTPEAPELQGHLADMERQGDRWAVVESTSHGLAQQRVGAVAYDVAVLTNITSEHLEFHGTLEAYHAAKESLFARLATGPHNPDKGWGKHAVVNADDPSAATIGRIAADAGATVWRYGLAGQLAREPADLPDIAALELEENSAGMRFVVHTPSWQGKITLRLAGRFNVYNALAALAVAESLGLDLDVAARALAELDSVPGRMQRISLGQPFSLVIDYAHTAESLAKVLDELAPSEPGAGLIAVFGSAGERDTEKRAQMGRVAGERCRLVVVTDEDPRGEDRWSILDAIADGATAGGKTRGEDLLVVPERAEAIDVAVRAARAGDAVLLAGKGHERTIETADGNIAWDEAGAARHALAALGYR